MRLFIAPRAGDGTSRSAFRPDVVTSAVGGSLGNYELPDGRFLCVAPDATSAPTGCVDLGRDPAAPLTTTRRNLLADAFGTDRGVAGSTVGEAIVMADGGRLAPVRGRTLVSIAGVDLYDAPAIRGGATDAFPYADGNLTIVSSGVWVARTGTFNVSTNRCVASATGVDTAAYWSTAATDDQYSQATSTFAGSSGYGDGGVATRMATGAQSHYMLVHSGATHTISLYKCVTGTFTDLGGYVTGLTAETITLRLESIGSSHTGYQGGVLRVTATDAVLTSGRIGIHSYLDTGSATTYVDDWDGGSLGSSATLADNTHRRRHALISRGYR